MKSFFQNKSILVTGGAGFIGSNLIEALLDLGSKVLCMDNFSTGSPKNIEAFLGHPNFRLFEGDIRNLAHCMEACANQELVFHQAALGSVPRSVNDPLTTNDVNITGFLNMLLAARDTEVKRMVYAASSSTYGDSESLPKIEDTIGKPLSPYAITKYVNELYADVFARMYGFESIGLRYFNVFGRKQDPEGAYAAVIPKWVMQFMRHQSPIINGDGAYSRDFTYIDNVIQANLLAASTTNSKAINQVYNIAYGERSSLNQLAEWIRQSLSHYDAAIADIPILHGPFRKGDIPHSLASVDKAKQLLNYQPEINLRKGLELACEWYWEHLDRV